LTIPSCAQTQLTGFDYHINNFDCTRPVAEVTPFGLNYHDGVGKAKSQDGSWYFIGRNGEHLNFDDMQGFFDGLCIVKRQGKFGIINQAYEEVFPPEYECIIKPSFSYIVSEEISLLYYAKKDNSWVTIDFSNNTIVSFSKSYAIGPMIRMEDCRILIKNSRIVDLSVQSEVTEQFTSLYSFVPMFDGVEMFFTDNTNAVVKKRLSFEQGAYSDEIAAKFDDEPEGDYIAALLSSSIIEGAAVDANKLPYNLQDYLSEYFKEDALRALSLVEYTTTSSEKYYATTVADNTKKAYIVLSANNEKTSDEYITVFYEEFNSDALPEDSVTFNTAIIENSVDTYIVVIKNAYESESYCIFID